MRFTISHLRRSPLSLGACVLAAVTVTGAGAATMHRFAATGYTGTEGAFAYNNPSATGAAIEGTVGSTDTKTAIPFGVAGEYNASTSTFGIGIGGYSTSGVGAAGAATGKYSAVYGIYDGKGSGSKTVGTAGVEGHTEYGSSSSSGILGVSDVSGAAGVVGIDKGSSSAGVGTYGGSNEGVGVLAQLNETSTTHSQALIAVSSTSTAGTASLGDEDGQAVLGFGTRNPGATPAPIIQANGYNTSSPLFAGVAENAAGTVQSLGFAVQASSQNRSGTVSTSGGASDVQVQGDLYLTGKVFTGCSSFPVTSSSTCGSTGATTAVRARNGIAMAAYSGVHASPTLEDDGEATISNGGAHVALDPAFASTIASDRPYLVFVTPMGRSGQLYVTNRSLSGFDVRENGAASTVTFDYRIVARPFATTATERIAAVRPNAVNVAKLPAAYLPNRIDPASLQRSESATPMMLKP